MNRFERALSELRQLVAGIDAGAEVRDTWAHFDNGAGLVFEGRLRVDDETRKRLPYFFRCTKLDCGRELQLARCFHIRVADTKTDERKLDIRYTCACTRHPLQGLYRISTDNDKRALMRLLYPFKIRLPYVAPDAGRTPVIPDADDEATAVRWTWEVEQLESVDELLLFLGEVGRDGDE